MTLLVGWLMVVSGLALVLVAGVAWLGAATRPSGTMRIGDASVFDLLVELLHQAPWVAVVGGLLIWVEVKLLGFEVGL